MSIKFRQTKLMETAGVQSIKHTNLIKSTFEGLF